jgi:hypothetical protein
MNSHQSWANSKLVSVMLWLISIITLCCAMHFATSSGICDLKPVFLMPNPCPFCVRTKVEPAWPATPSLKQQARLTTHTDWSQKPSDSVLAIPPGASETFIRDLLEVKRSCYIRIAPKLQTVCYLRKFFEGNESPTSHSCKMAIK